MRCRVQTEGKQKHQPATMSRCRRRRRRQRSERARDYSNEEKEELRNEMK